MLMSEGTNNTCTCTPLGVCCLHVLNGVPLPCILSPPLCMSFTDREREGERDESGL